MTRATPVFGETGPVDVPYGADRPPASAQTFDSVPRVRIRAGESLRLNSETFLLPPPAIGQGHVPLDERLAAHLRRLSGEWNRLGAAFVDAYFAYLRGVIDARRSDILDRLGPLASLFRPEDTLYSALLPLPRALLPLPAVDGETRWVPVDMAFWDGERAHAVLFSPSSLLPAAERRRRESLLAAGVDVTGIAAADLAQPGLFPALLGARGQSFWRDEPLPVAPGAPPLPEF